MAGNDGSKSNRVRDQTFRLCLDLGLWKEEDKKAVNYKIEQTAGSIRRQSSDKKDQQDESD